MKHGIYETIYGNACRVDEESEITQTAWDLDMRETIPIEFVEFDRFIKELD